MANLCPCDSGKSYPACCEPFVKGTAHAPTAEALMRSRYSAYVKGNIDHVERTHDHKSRDQFDRNAAKAWSEQTDWLGLEVKHTEGGAESDHRGVVEFIARYRTAVPGTEPQTIAHHEIATFAKEHGHWVYVDGKIVRPPVVREGPKLGRNDPCSCGSGKKFKKCCGAG